MQTFYTQSMNAMISSDRHIDKLNYEEKVMVKVVDQ